MNITYAYRIKLLQEPLNIFFLRKPARIKEITTFRIRLWTDRFFSMKASTLVDIFFFGKKFFVCGVGYALLSEV